MQASLSLRRQLQRYLLWITPCVWVFVIAFSYNRASHEINELFDTEQVRLAQQLGTVLPGQLGQSNAPKQTIPSVTRSPALAPPKHHTGDAEPEDMSITVWDAQGRQWLADREGASLPYQPGFTGFMERDIRDQSGHEEPWRIYYLSGENDFKIEASQSIDQQRWTVAIGQRIGERNELVYDLIISQLLPWLVLLPVMIFAISYGIRRGIAPLQRTAEHISHRKADDFSPIQSGLQDPIPEEVAPIIDAMNGLLARIEHVLQYERQITADAAHELKTPVAALQAQLEVMQLTHEGERRDHALSQARRAVERLNHLIQQLLISARIDYLVGEQTPTSDSTHIEPLNWPDMVAQVLNDCASQIENKQADIQCESLDDHNVRPFLQRPGDASLWMIVLRNLVDNALRYGGEQPIITIRFYPDGFEVSDRGPGVRQTDLNRLGSRFFRANIHQELGSGLGLSIVKRIAELHGATVTMQATDPQSNAGTGLCVRIKVCEAKP